ncbi:MAG: hypothetical protein V3V92_04615 [Candidatus Hydrothermarchaeales archaeon]
MLLKDFIEYSKRFEVGFLGTVGGKGPDLKPVHFEVDERGVVIKGNTFTEGKACVAFSNDQYVWGSENASVNGHLEKTKDGEYLLVPEMAVWTIGFDIKDRPHRIVKRWKKQ